MRAAAICYNSDMIALLPKTRRFLRPLLIITAVLCIAHLVSSGSFRRPREFRRPLDLDRPSCRIGVLAGYSSETVSRNVFPSARIVPFREFDEAYMSLLGGRIEAFVYSEHTLNVALRAYPQRLQMLEEPLAQNPSVVLVATNRPELVTKLNAFIRGYRRSGYYDEMYARWCLCDAYVPMPHIPEADGSRGVLRIGTSGTEEPTSFIDDKGELTGFDIEFIRRFAQVNRLKPQIVCLPDDEILDELRACRLDIVIDNYNVSEVSGGALVSDVYLDSDMRVLVRNPRGRALPLGSNRLGYAKRFIADPRIGLFVVGFLTTLALTFLSAFFGFLFAGAFLAVNRRSPRSLQNLLDTLMDAVRMLPPPVILLAIGSILLTSSAEWVTAVVSFAIWFASFIIKPGFLVRSKDDLRIWLNISRVKLVELMQWTSVVGSINLCDLTMAGDIVCGRSVAAFGPLVSIAAAYCLMNWIVDRGICLLERRFT